jgi:hypothetical protein
MIFVLLDFLAALPVCFFVGRAAWRAIRDNVAGGTQAGSSSAAGVSPTRPEIPGTTNPASGLGLISLWTAIAGVVLPALLALGTQLAAPPQRLSDAFVLCCVLGGLLELVALGCGIVARRTGTGKAGLIIAGGSLVVGLLVFSTTASQRGPSDSGPTETVSDTAAAVPPLGTITSGIGAEFTVPAAQVAVFEIVTRRNGETVALPPHCGYVMAAPDAPIAGTLRWSRQFDDGVTTGRGRIWGLEIVTAGGGRGYSEGTLVPDELNDAVGARGLTLGTLAPNEEVIHWGISDVRDLPADGLIGLRVTVVAHDFNTGGSGNAHIDWKKTQSAQSTTRRKLPSGTP